MDSRISMEASKNRINILPLLEIEAQLLGRHPVAKSQCHLWSAGSQLNINSTGTFSNRICGKYLYKNMVYCCMLRADICIETHSFSIEKVN